MPEEQAIRKSGLQEITEQEKAIPVNPLPLSGSLLSFGRGLPSLSKKLVDQIRSNQYIDFADLPPARGKVRTPHQPTMMEGQIVLIQTADLSDTKKIIPDLAVRVVAMLCCICGSFGSPR